MSAACLQTIAQREVAALLGINSGRSPQAKQRRKQNIIVQVCQSLPSIENDRIGVLQTERVAELWDVKLQF